ncbi:MAG: AI-2E family transporter [Mycobacterium sp.]|uniref:AI-2E family transporter n=1 Tax=Mycobacterium sp. TaxID=1785 RepID=UPI003F950D21
MRAITVGSHDRTAMTKARSRPPNTLRRKCDQIAGRSAHRVSGWTEVRRFISDWWRRRVWPSLTGAVSVLDAASSVLVLIAAAMFFALGLEPAVSGLVNRRLPRWAAVSVVVVAVFGVLAGAVAAAIPPLVAEARQFIDQVPHYVQQAQDHSTVIGKISERFHVQQRIMDTIHGPSAPALGGVLKAGETVFGALSHVGIVAVITVYFLADMGRIRAAMYRLVPNSRRPRAILIGDEVMAKVGDYVFGNVLTSLIAGAATCAWCFIFHVPYALLLGVFVAIVDLFPYGSSIGGFVVALVALTVSIPVSIATVVFYIAFRLAEDYLLTPKIIGRAVRVPGGVTVVAVLIGAGVAGGRGRPGGDSGRRGSAAAGFRTVVSHAG